MNGDIKRRIDTARDVLVGKIPDPKSQVEQITLALIYRFMDYMDRQSEEWGGSARFFTNGYEKYAWSNLVNPQIGGYERLDLYTEALVRMTQNPHLPQLFRDIFKNAYLPYRDPETLRLFLTEIDGFPLEHTEDLGDAYEYLLSIMSSQGDAGQFRTPRHIIDFIVRCVDPKKEDTILDPACGTAGFLICAYLHIMEQNAQDGRPGGALTVDEKAALVKHFSGYDISPDMVRLSLVNMYFHGFQSPSIHEYDTLTSEERWDETFDVIMANPPFMTPKGGIKPHKRFSVQANRSEVLFVDYIMEHLTPSGRAGVIVPEGIIFQSSNAYKSLRKMLVEDRYLYAVVSLPAGVFSPYAGVKTSILLMDRELGKRTDEILFVKIENDGFDLGAQRRPIDRNDLPEALEIVNAWKRHVADPSVPFTADPKRAHAVPKAKIAATGDFNLSSDRYRDAVANGRQRWPVAELGELCELYQPKTITQSDLVEDGPYLVFGANGVIGRYDQYNHEESEVLITCRGATCGTVNKSEPKSWVTGNAMVAKPKDSRLSKSFLYSLLKGSDLSRTISGSAQPQITRQGLAPFEIPLPPLEVQQQIVTEIDAWQKVIDGASQVVANYKPTIPVDPAWPMVELREICSLEYGFTASAEESGDVRFIRITDISDDGGLRADGAKYLTLSDASRPYLLQCGDLLVARTGATYGKTLCFDGTVPAVFASYLIRLRPDRKRLLPSYYWAFTLSEDYQRQKGVLVQGGGQPQFNANVIQKIRLPLPPLEVQDKVVAEIEEEQKLVDANKRLIEIHEAKIKAKIAEVWGDSPG